MINWKKTTSGECSRLDQVPKGATVVAIDDVAVIGRCEGCGIYIMEGDDYESDGEGVQLCPKCAKECAEDYVRHEQDPERNMHIGDPLIRAIVNAVAV